MSANEEKSITLCVPTDSHMRALGESIAHIMREGDVVLLSGPLGAGKTTFAQGLGTGLKMNGPIVSPTFTIARQLHGTFANGKPATLVHVDAYRLGGQDFAPGQDSVSRLLDELESLGLDEALEDPAEGTVVLMEWGEQMAGVLSDTRLEIHIDRPLQSDCAEKLTSDGNRIVTLIPYGGDWSKRISLFSNK